MGLELKQGNIWKSKAHAIVIPTNTKGVMGAGLAKEFAKKFPTESKYYQKVCAENKIPPGVVVPIAAFKPFWIICFTTKDHWKQPSQLEYIVNGLEDLKNKLPYLEIQSIAIPALGCGLGGLNWKEVYPIMEEALASLPVDVEIYEPGEEDSSKAKVYRRRTKSEQKTNESL